MKTKLSVFTVLVLCLTLMSACALGATANASIVAPETVKVTAPFAGTLRPFDLSMGEAVNAGDVLFEIDTIPVYASQAGTVAAVLADVGDDAQGVIARHGAVAVIEPELALYIDASTTDAYDDEDNKYLHAGETLYLKCGNEKGKGRVTSVNDKKYVVEILEGTFEVGDTVRCFRESAMPSDSETGRGKVKRYADTAVTAAGRVAAVHVQPGDTVAMGDLLFEMIDAQSARNASPAIGAPISGAVTLMQAMSGAQVYRGMLLCEIADLSALELSAEVDELDLAAIRVGDVLSYTLDAYGEKSFSGTVTQIRPIGSARQNATYFDVRITAPQDVTILPGMNATVILP
ncbi:MAG: efflux RND transporter periplasmic adaptor subunit [Clostridia bacterium]|nr:efflux RND transporter periplasmic adaptor subunit [Clostridia bacterium]